MHPSQPGYLLLSNRDRSLILLDLMQSGDACRMQPAGQWILPVQIDAKKIIYFQKLMQPPGLIPVLNKAQCK